MSDDLPTGKAGLRTELATPQRDIFAQVWVDLLRTTDDVLRDQGGGKGLKLYDEIERDPVAYAVLMKRKLGLIARSWTVEPASDRSADKKAAELVERILDGEWGLSFDGLCLDLLDATLMGYAVAEVIWSEADGFWLPMAVKPKDQRRFVFDVAGQIRLLTRENSWRGIDLPERKFIVHRFGDKSGDPYGRGLGHQLYWWVYFKRLATQFWMVFAEKFGSPSVVGEVPDLMSTEDEETLLEKLARLSQETALTVPAGTIVKFLEAVRSGDVTYPQLVEYCDRMITLTVLGQTLTTSEGAAGSRALGQVHKDVADEIVDADADLLSATLNGQLLAWITYLNYPDAKPPRVWRPRPAREEAEAKTEQEQLKARRAALDFIDAMRRSGWEPEDPAADITEQWRGKWTHPGQPSGVAAPADPLDPAQPSDQATLAGDDDGGPGDLADQLDRAAGGAMDAIVGRVRSLLDQVEAEGGELADVLPRLADIYPALDVGDLALIIGKAMATANLIGRLDTADANRG